MNGFCKSSIILLFSLLFFVACENTNDINVPVLSSVQLSNVTFSTATSGGIIKSDGGSKITACGVCWCTKRSPTITDTITTDIMGYGSFASSISGLSSGTVYYMRAYATNKAGTGYGEVLEMHTYNLKDIDENMYYTVKIGTQEWMMENLKTTKYNDGSSIPIIADNPVWSTLLTGACCNYNNDADMGVKYGKLYNYYAVNTGMLPPKGWHIPSCDEWNTLGIYVKGHLGISKNIAGALAINTDNLIFNNSTGFSGLYGGYRTLSGTFGGIGYDGIWWSSTKSNFNTFPLYLETWFLDQDNLENAFMDNLNCCSIRCIKDN